ncbi:MAG TPA: aminopeptidase P N-terminal domain-containing protein [Gemmatimonadales bacterium]|nr:aminopeptidase P N-terminal domain-containing protein [Gemmatimonadales bacterium]
MFRFASMCLLGLLIAGPLPAQIPTAEYAARRDTVAAHLGDGVLLAFGAGEPMTDEADFHQLPAFQYLTGYDRVNAVFVMAVRGGRVTYQMLFEPPIDPRRALYDGFAPDSADLERRTGLGLRDRDRLREVMDGLAGRGTLWTVTDAHSRDYRSTDSLSAERYFVQRFWAAHPNVTVRSADALLDSLMVVKSPAEIALLRKAVDISVLGQIAAMKAVRPGVNEHDIFALTDYTFRMAGASGPSFRAIIGSGPNSTSYHYRANDRVMQAGEVVVMDMGALYDGYAGDVTRTVPVNGKYTADQAAIYSIVRSAQQAAADVARPGEPVGTGDKAIRAIMATELARLGLTEGPDATFDPPWADAARCERVPVVCTQAFLYMAHGPGHGIGLEVHDAGGYSYSPTGSFQLNEVFTIEPGIYISTALLDMLADTPKNRAFIARVRPVVERYNHIGIRIEDDYLVTPTGVEWLSKAPREIREIEAVMQAAAKSRRSGS